MNYIVFDLEFNQPCTINKVTNALERGNSIPEIPQEIIEIGAVKLDGNFDIIDTFKAYVKPQVYKSLNPKVMKLTKITYKDLKFAHPFSACMEDFLNWIEEDNIFCSWGIEDVFGLRYNCNFYNIDFNWFTNYLDVQKMYTIQKKIKPSSQASLKDAIVNLNIISDRKNHQALNDSTNTAFVLQKLTIDNIEKYLIKSNKVIPRKLLRIVGIDDDRLKKSKLKSKCPRCGRFIPLTNKWNTNGGNIFWATGVCKKCDEYVSSRARIDVKSKDKLRYKITHKIVSEEWFEKYRQ